MRFPLRRTTSADPAFVELIRRLDAELRDRYGELQAAYAPHNVVVTDHAVVAYDDDVAVGSGCFKRIDPTTIEIKRMYVATERRGEGIGRSVLQELEAWARELGHTDAIVETGVRQPEAVELYEASGYTVIDNFPPYVGLATSVCLHKRLRR